MELFDAALDVGDALMLPIRSGSSGVARTGKNGGATGDAQRT